MNYNEVETARAKKAGAVTSSDDDPLAPVGREGMDLGVVARPAPVDMGQRGYPSPVTEHRALPVNLPESVTCPELVARNKELWDTGPADSEATAPLLAGTKVVTP